MASLSDITVAISTNISNFQKGLDRAQRRLQKAGKGFKEAGTTMSQSLTLPLAAAGAAAVKVASDFEDAMVEIEKVTSSATADELRSSIKAMAAEIPLAQSELAGLAADAARFGISGPKSIEKFTRTAAKMATATELSTQEASESLAKLAEVTDTPVSKMENLGSAVNSLSNTAGTSSQEIVDNMLRASKGLSALGVNQKEMAGLAATLNEVSPSATNAGTQLNRLSSQLLDPRIVKELSNILGMTSAEFNELRKNSPVKLMQKLASSFSNGGQQARKLRAALSEQSVKAVSGLAQNIGGLSRNLDTSSTAFRQNTSLSNEAEKAYSKFSSQLQMALNRLRNVAITIGNKLMPFVLDLVGTIERGISAFSSLSSRMQDIIIVGAGIAAALGPVLFIFGFFVSSVLPGLISALSGVTAAFTTLLGPVGAIAAAVAAAATLIISNWQQVRAAFIDSGLGKLVATIGAEIKNGVQVIIGAIKFLFSQLNMTSKEGKNTFQSIMEGLFTVVKSIMSAFLSVLQTVFSAIAPIIVSATVALQKFSTFMTNIFVAPEKAIKALGDMFKQVFTGILNVLETVINGIFDFVQKLAGFIPGVGSAMESAKSAVTDAKEGIVDALDLKTQQKNIENTTDALTELKGKFREIGTGALPSLPSLGGGGAGGSQQDQGKDKPSLPQLVGNFTKDMQQQRPQRGAQGQGEGEQKTPLPQLVKQFQEDVPLQKFRQLEKVSNRIGQSFSRMGNRASRTFAKTITGAKGGKEAMMSLAQSVKKSFEQMIQKVIQLIIKLTVMKALKAAIGGGLGGLGGGGLGGSLIQGLMGGGGSSGGGMAMPPMTSTTKGEDIITSTNRTSSARGRAFGAGVG